jgi:hypothetical protein
VAIIDADDVWEPARLGRGVDFLERNPSIAVVGSNILFIDESSRVVGQRRYPTSPREIAFRRWIENPFANASTLTRAHVMRELRGYDESLVWLHDYELWMRLLDRYLGANLPDFLLRYRISTTQSKSRHVKTVLRGSIKLKRERMPAALRGDPQVTGRLWLENAMLALPSQAIVRLFYLRHGLL